MSCNGTQTGSLLNMQPQRLLAVRVRRKKGLFERVPEPDDALALHLDQHGPPMRNAVAYRVDESAGARQHPINGRRDGCVRVISHRGHPMRRL